MAAILGESHAHALTLLIGVSEIAMAAWIITGWRYRQCAAVQIAVIAGMNIIVFFAVPHLLLWGHLNALFAAMLVVLIYMNAFAPEKLH